MASKTTFERPLSPAESAYSIHLSALGGSETSSMMPTEEIERVLSEEMDGPSDFTENIVAYLKDAPARKGSQKSAAQQTKQDEDVLPTMIRHPSQRQTLFEDEQASSRQTSTKHPLKDSAPENRAHDDAADDISSIWEPFNEGRTPLIQAQLKRMQPRVEDYQSELSPVRVSSIRPSQTVIHNQYNTTTRTQNAGKRSSSQSSTQGRLSSPTLSPEHSPSVTHAIPVPSPVRNSPQPYMAPPSSALMQELEEMRARCSRLESQNAALTQSLEEGRRARLEEKANHEAMLATLRHQAKMEKAEKKTAVEKAKKDAEERMSAKTTTTEATHAATVSALNTAIVERDALQDNLNTAQLELEDQKAVNEEFDARISTKITKREESWLARMAEKEKQVEEMERERKLMARTLMVQWGREEVGIDWGGRQRYKYAFPDNARKVKGRSAPIGASS